MLTSAVSFTLTMYSKQEKPTKAFITTINVVMSYHEMKYVRHPTYMHCHMYAHFSLHVMSVDILYGIKFYRHTADWQFCRKYFTLVKSFSTNLCTRHISQA